MFTIGQFSRITGLTIKTIRLYHEKGLLPPGRIDERTGYRYFNQRNVEQARTIAYLRELAFPLAEIKEILDRFEEEADILTFLVKHRQDIRSRIERLGKIASSLDEIIQKEQEAKSMFEEGDFTVGEKDLAEVEVAGIRWKGRYSETGKALQQLGKLAGRHIRGKPMNLYYDGEYREEDADIESCFPVGEMKKSGALALHRLPAGRCVCLVHKGPYQQLGRSYARIMDYIQSKKYEAQLPMREVYIKGPGMIFRGNPKKYLTEIQIMISRSAEVHDEKS
jgi:DNA-binding transcriptional MerR regulator/DNA gyrase inhibitor GyrI